MLADYPEAYEGQPGLEFIEKVPTVWDDTKVLSGFPGESIVMARRKGDVWYLGAMTNWDPRDLAIPLDFLGPGEYEARVFADGPDAASDGTSLSVETKTVKAGDSSGRPSGPRRRIGRHPDAGPVIDVSVGRLRRISRTLSAPEF